jgi:hypothetical protein
MCRPSRSPNSPKDRETTMLEALEIGGARRRLLHVPLAD